MSGDATPPRRAYLLDLDDTLVPWQTPAHWQWAWRPQGPVISERHARAAIKRALHAWDRRRWNGVVGDRPVPDLADLRQHLKETLAEVAGHALPPAETEAVVDRFLHPAGAFEAFPDAQPAVESLLKRGDRVGVATPLPESVARNALRRAGLSDQLLVLHGEDGGEGPGLPSPPAFRRAAGRLDSRPKEVVFVGDLFWSDVRAAARAGLQAVLIDRSDHWSRVTGRRIRRLDELLQEAPPPPASSPAPEPNP